MLKVKNLSVSYTGSIRAIHNIELDVKKGEIVGFIGANGAGKTTILRAISGLLKKEEGSSIILDLSTETSQEDLARRIGVDDSTKLVEFYGSSELAIEKIIEFGSILKKEKRDVLTLDDICVDPVFKSINKLKKIYNKYMKNTYVDLNKVPSHTVVNYGLAHVPEGRQVFANLTVEENLEMGAYSKTCKEEIFKDLQKMYEKFPRLKERKKQKAGTLSGGEQQMLAIARALMSRPKIILLDEPSMGLAPILVQEVFDLIKELNETGITVLLVEQNAKQALQISDYSYILETGKIRLQGKSKDLLNSDEVKKIYLGEE